LRSHALVLGRAVIASAHQHQLRLRYVLRKHLQPQPQISQQLLERQRGRQGACVCRGLGRRPRQDVEATLSEMHGVRQVVNLLPCNRIRVSNRRRRSASAAASAAPAKSHMRRSTPSSNSRRLTCTDTVRCSGAMGGDRPSFSALIRLVLPTCSSSQHTVANARVCTHHLRPDDHHAAAAGGK